MKNKVGILKNLIDEQTVEQIIQKYEMLPKKDDGLRFEADTLICLLYTSDAADE